MRKDEGTSSIELAVSISMIVFLLFWLLEISLALWTKTCVAQAAQEGVRYAVVSGTSKMNPYCSGPGLSRDGSPCTDSQGANVVQRVSKYTNLAFHGIPDSSIQVSYPNNSNAPGSRVEVKVEYNYVPWLAFTGVRPTFETAVSGRIVN